MKIFAKLILFFNCAALFPLSSSTSIDDYLLDAFHKNAPLLKNPKIGIYSPLYPYEESIPTAHKFLLSITTHLETLTFDSLSDVNSKQFDAIVAISTVEYCGLGIFNADLLDSDLHFMTRIKDRLTPNGVLFLSVPVGLDLIIENSHRIYGHNRLRSLLKGWQILGYFGFTSQDLDCDASLILHKPVFVLKQKQLTH